ncbi:type IV toxin-antitoxin system AbiEi family antitoxin domain-containing protein [Bacteroidales bacterium OttesenSCG-928-B11]|nr:type IV toxin-antitoxin system AbiEi family antitoxin domain-containing protein [Bacteroidales bacterium OttesenSCG-928-E04]MDL2311265.1 type IV toxin-antitoxin system AbiEi family antitoxin domain-containing protein [Bacteroidales bacterium OttesenSCG-928-B11]
MPESVSQIIRERAKCIEKGKLFTISDFEDLNNDSLVTRALSRLQKEGAIVRVATGIYMNPKKTQFGILHPTIDQIAQKIAERDKAQIMPTGDTALNILGFSTQVPMNAVYITNGAKRKVKVGERTIIFKNVIQKNFQYKGKILPLIIIALKELGEEHVTDVIRNKIIKFISDSNAEEKSTMMHDLYLAPVWIKELLLPIIKTTNQ